MLLFFKDLKFGIVDHLWETVSQNLFLHDKIYVFQFGHR